MNVKEDSVRFSSKYPEKSAAALTHAVFPSRVASYRSVGTPVGCFFNPFILTKQRGELLEEDGRFLELGTKIARCGQCSAYFNPHCDATQLRWFCSICGSRNMFTRGMVRYRQIELRLLPESNQLLIDYPIPIPLPGTGASPDSSDVLRMSCSDRPQIQIFVVQENMQIDAMEAVVEALTAAVSRIHPDIHVILMVVSCRLGVYRFSSRSVLPVLQYFHLAGSQGSKEGAEVVASDPSLSDSKFFQSLGCLDLFEVACRVGDCRDSVRAAVSSLFDSFSNNSEADGGSSGSQMDILPCVREVIYWVLGEDTNDGSIGLPNSEVREAHGEKGAWFTGELLDAIQGLSNALLGSDGEATSRVGPVEDASVGRPRPCELCSGIVINLFLSENSNLKSCLDRSNVSSQVIQELSTKCREYSLVINSWLVTSFEGHSAGGVALLPLVQATGGTIQRCVLGMCPRDERTRFSESVARVISQPWATRCTLKLRTPNLWRVAESYGSQQLDEGLDGVYRLSGCHPGTCIGFGLEMAESNEKSESIVNEESDSIVMQLAFSYETLVESGEQSDETYESIDEKEDAIVGSSNDFFQLTTDMFGLGDDVQLRNRVASQRRKGRNSKRTTSKQRNGSFSSSVERVEEEEPSSEAIPCVLGNWKSCEYNHSKRLVAVRRLRTITVMVECSNKVPRILQSIQPSVLALLLSRHASHLENGLLSSITSSSSEQVKPLESLEPFDVLGLPSESSSYLHEVAASLVVKAAILIRNLRRDSQIDPTDLVREAMSQGLVKRTLRFIFGVLNIVCVIQQSLTSGNRGDEGAELTTWLNTFDHYEVRRIIYPELLLIDALGELQHTDSPIPLKRESMVLASRSPSSQFLLDSGIELILYRSATPNSVQEKGVAQALQVQNRQEEEHLLSPCWLGNDLDRRLRISSIIPRLFISEGGTATAGYLTSHLLEDMSQIRGGACFGDFEKLIVRWSLEALQHDI